MSTSASTPVYHSVSRMRTESNMLLPCRARIHRRIQLASFGLFAWRRGLARSGNPARHRVAKHISRAAPRVDQRMGGGRIDFAPQPFYIDLDGVREGDESFITHMLGNLVAAAHTAFAARHTFHN